MKKLGILLFIFIFLMITLAENYENNFDDYRKNEGDDNQYDNYLQNNYLNDYYVDDTARNIDYNRNDYYDDYEKPKCFWGCSRRRVSDDKKTDGDEDLPKIKITKDKGYRNRNRTMDEEKIPIAHQNEEEYESDYAEEYADTKCVKQFDRVS